MLGRMMETGDECESTFDFRKMISRKLGLDLIPVRELFFVRDPVEAGLGHCASPILARCHSRSCDRVHYSWGLIPRPLNVNMHIQIPQYTKANW